ncbi:MAG TPA: D-aminoacylase [Usitatibacter sp.]|nr:D-aminoacylase [Usitatibacter sp.]
MIRNATVIDGSGAPRYSADIAVQAGTIAAIGRDLPRGDAEIDASGLVAAPGFIDAHTHDDRLMLSAPDMAPKVSQGVTTVVAGNCGISLAPAPRGMARPVTPPLDLLDDEGSWFRFPTFASYVEALEASPAATNCALLVGHSALRVQTVSDLNRPATAAEEREMRRLAEDALAAGAIGISTGLWYEPAQAATTEEVIEVCRPLTARGALYCTHMRDEADDVTKSLEEAFRIGRELAVRVVISHHKVAGVRNHGRSKETLALIDRCMQRQPIGLDCYPYCASSTILSYDRTLGASRTLVSWSRPHPEVAGMDLEAIAKRMGRPVRETVEALLPAGAVYFAMDEADVQRILAFPETMVGSDGLPHDAAPHPRLWGTFPRVLGHYARDVGLFSLETAVHKMTGLTAKTFGLADRGLIAQGMAADLTLFDAQAVGDAATFESPIRAAPGIAAVIVNGEVAWREGHSTGARPGKVLDGRRQGRSAARL